VFAKFDIPPRRIEQPAGFAERCRINGLQGLIKLGFDRELSRSEEWLLPPGRPMLTGHLVGDPDHGDDVHRWVERTPRDAVSPERAWERGEDLDVTVAYWTDEISGQRADRVRLYAEDSDHCGRWIVGILVLIEEGDQIAFSAIRCDDWDDPAQRSYVHSRAEEVIQS